ncbi:MAG: glycoside hydrolase family 16 protein [Bacteroidia bacterium]|nr:glycoside hydrolase family 16 protein [Bacteroidia bacterium]
MYFPIDGQVMIEFREKSVRKWELSDGDEFNGDGLDREKWMTSYPWARHLYCSMDVNYYSDGDDLICKEGLLNISARVSPVQARSIPYERDDFLLPCDFKAPARNLMQFDYQSGLIYSKKNFLYGYFEINFRTDAGQGLWPAFWLFGADNQEIDIFEIGGGRTGDFHVDVHCKKGCKNYPVFLGLLRTNWGDYVETDANWQKEYHTIAVDWEPEGITWYLDGKAVAWWKGSFKEALALIANLAVTNKAGSLGGAISAATPFPAFMQVDYIRVWQKSNEPVLRLTAESMKASYPLRPTAPSRLLNRKRPEFKRSVLKQPFTRLRLLPVPGGSIRIEQEGTLQKEINIAVFKKGQSLPLSQILVKAPHMLFSPGLKPGVYELKAGFDGKSASVVLEVP